MRKSTKEVNNHFVGVLLIVFIYLSIGITIIFQDINYLLSRFLRDDAYYYYEISKNIAEGQGPVFNEGTLTNGFHPLYAGILVPVFHFFYQLGPNVPIRISLFILLIANVGTGVFLYLTILEYTNKNYALFGIILWLLNFIILRTSLSGIETPIQTLFISAFVWYILRNDTYVKLNHKQSVIVGSLLGFIFLARMDGVFLLIGYILTTVIKRFYSMTGKSAADTLSKFSDIFWTVATAGIVVSPWFIYNIVYLGKIFPVSGSATRAINIAWSGGIFPAVWAVFKNIAADVSLYVFAVGQTDTVIVLAPIVLVAMIYIGIYMIGSNPNVLIDFAFLITSAVLHFCYYLFYQLAWRKWYPMFMFYILTLILVIGLGKMMLEEYKIKNPVSEHRLTTLLIVGVFVLSSFGGFYIHHQTGESNYYNSWKNTADHINSNYSEDDRFIASGSGILQYYTSNSDIYEWRGVVNSNIYQARNDGEIKGFVRSKNISYIIDYEDTTVGDHIYNNELAGFDAEKISCHPAKRTNKTFCTYRIRSV